MSIFKKNSTSDEVEKDTVNEENTNTDNQKKKPDITVSREEFVNTALNNIAKASVEKCDDGNPIEDDEDDFDYPDDFISYSDAEADISPVNPPAPVAEQKVKVKKEKPFDEEKQKIRKAAIRKFKRKFRKVFVTLRRIFVFAVLVCAGIYIYACATVPVNRLGRNIYIENVNVSDMTFEEAVNAVRDAGLLTDQTISLTCNNQTYLINGADVGLTAKIEDTVDKAMRYGKTKNIFIDGFANSLQIFFRHTVIPTANVNEEIIRAKLTELGEQVHGKLVEHKLEIGDGVVIGTPGHTGFDSNTDIAYNEIIHAIENEQFTNIAVTLSAGPPHQYSAEEVGYFTYCDPIDAWYHYVDNTVTIVDEIPGRYINLEETANLITQLKEGGEIIYIPYYNSQAAITAEILRQKLFSSTIASYSTNYGGSTSNRCANIANAASKINNKILAPGEVFSFNQTVGRRSTANGFYTAKEYVDGQTVDGIGGGTCQVSSTLYNAVLYADLSVVSRLNHMFPVNYCPIGQDATVSDSGVDFKFVNNMDYPVKISAYTSGYTVTVSIIGTQRDIPHTVKIENKSKAVGEDTSVHSYRYVYNPAGELLRKDDLGKSYYMSHSKEN